MANDLEVKRYYWSASSKTSTGEAITIDSVDTTKAFSRALNTLWGANNGGATNYIKDLGAAPAITGATTCTVNLAGSASNSNVREGYFEVWEYTGPVGGSSEVKVLHHGVETLTGTSTVITLDNTASNLSNCVAIYGGLIGPAFANTATTVGDQAAVRLEVTATNQLTMSRFDGTTAVEVSVTVLEFVGSDWTVHKYNGSHPTSTAGSATHSLGFSVSDWAKSFFFFSHEVTSGNTGADDVTILPYVGSSTTSQIKTWHNVSSVAPPEFTLYVVEHASASVEHNDTLDGTVPQGTFKPTTTITAPTSYALSTAIGFNGATSDSTAIMSSAAWTGWLSDSTTFATDYGAGSTDELMQTGFQIIDLDAVAGSTLTAVSVGRPSESDASSGVTSKKIRQVTLGVASESDASTSVTAKRTYYKTVGTASESDGSSTVTAKRTYYVTVDAVTESSTLPSVAVTKSTSVGIASEILSVLPVAATKYINLGAGFERPAGLIPQVALDFEPLPARPINHGWDQSDIPDGLAYDHVVMPNGEKAIELPWVSKYTGVDAIESHQAGSTVAFWLKLGITLGDGYSTRTLAWNVNSSLGQNIIFYSTGEIKVRRYHAGGWDQQTVYGGTDALTQEWHHYAATLSEDLTTVKFYIDGELVSTITDSYVAPPDAYANFRGWSGWTSGDGSESIDLWQGPQEVYNRELSEPEIKAVMQQLYRGAVGAQQVVSTKYSQVQAATEGETVYDVAADKLVSVASSSSAESAAALSADKYTELGPTTSVDSSVAVSTTKYVTVGVASTGFTATPVSAVKYTSVAAGSSTESALAVSTDRSVTVANVPETNSALPLDLVKYVTVAPATVGMVATDVNVAKYTTLTSGDALETATGVQVVKYASVVDSPETDATSDVAPTKIISLTGASETGALTSVAAVKHVTVSSAGELDSTFSVTTEATVTATAVKAQETDSTSGPSVVKYVAVGTVNGTEAATTLSVTRFLNATGAGNTETAVSVADFRVSTAAVASTSESALPVTTYRVVTPGAALETQVATGTTFFKDHRVSPALETSVASVVSYADGVMASVGVAREFEDVLDVTIVAYVPVVEALGVDQARPVKTAKFTTLTAAPVSVETVPEVLVTKSIELVRTFGGENARPVKPRHVSSPDSIVETNAANTVSVAKYTAVGAASCNEAATVATATRIIYVAQTNETDDSGSISYDKFLKGATETDTAAGVFWVKKHKFVSSAAIEAAECRNFSAARCLN